MEKIKAKVEQVLHKDKDTDTTHTGTTHTGTTHSTTHTGATAGHSTGTTNTYGSDPTGPHDSRLGNKADPRVDSDQVGGYGNTASTGGTTHTGGYGTGHSTTHTPAGTHGSDPSGPHDSKLANKLDPRVDSDQYGSAGNTGHSTTGGYGNTGHSTTGGYGNTGHSTTGGYGNTGGYDSTHTGSTATGGPHSSNLANKVDPTVKTSSTNTGYGNTGHSATGGLGNAGHSTTGGYGSDPTGPHDSRLGNKADPRVDSDRVGGYGNTGHSATGGLGNTGHSTTGGYGNTGHSATGGYGGHSDPTGPHDSRLGNKADPRVDSDQYGSASNTGYGNTGNTGYGNTAGTQHSGLGQGNTHTGNTHAGGLGGGPGPAPNTAGPHSSNMANKLDPRVDSDLDGGKTYGGDRTYG